MIWISEGDLNQRVVEMTARFDRLGETSMRDAGGATDCRWIQWIARCPFVESEMARFQYDEYYERSGAGWQMVKYEYDFMEMTRNSRIAFHMHPMTAPAPTAHAHCEPMLGNPVHEHYRHIELTIHEALEEHLDWWARDIDLTCEGLRPLL